MCNQYFLTYNFLLFHLMYGMHANQRVYNNDMQVMYGNGGIHGGGYGARGMVNQMLNMNMMSMNSNNSQTFYFMGSALSLQARLQAMTD